MALPTLAFVWEQFSSYHIDRLEAAAEAFAGRRRVVGVEIASRSLTYAWKVIEGAQGWERLTLFPDQIADEVPWTLKLRRLLRTLADVDARDVFLCNQEHPENLLALPALRLQGRRVYAMLDGKFDDSPRSVLKEAAKQLVFRGYSGGLVAGARHQDYYRFLGMPAAWSRLAYDTVSVSRIRAAAGGALAPNGRPHAERDFVCVARFVAKKNLQTAIRAFAEFRRLLPESRRRLILCGSGALEAELRELASAQGVAESVVFAGFLGPDEVAVTLRDALALVLPSVEEQWGLVVNEAVALGIPVLCSDNVGARDTLVRSGVNGFIFEPNNVEGLAFFMAQLAGDEAMWGAFSTNCARFAPLGDVSEFVRGVRALIPGEAQAPFPTPTLATAS